MLRKTSKMSSPLPPLIVAGNRTPAESRPRVVLTKSAVGMPTTGAAAGASAVNS